MKIAFSQKIISPPKGIILAGYATEKPRENTGIHDDLYCKAIVVKNSSDLFAILILDLMCVDESLATQVYDALKPLGFDKDNIIVAGIHSHSAPSGVYLGSGELEPLNHVLNNRFDNAKKDWLNFVVKKCFEAVSIAINNLENFVYRFANTDLPKIGSDRNTGEKPKGKFNILEFKTESNKRYLIYNFACHPTVMNSKNLLVSADFIGHIAPLANRDICVFFNGPAGDVSTRFYRKESSFDECNRMAKIAVKTINSVINICDWIEPKNFSWKKIIVDLEMREIKDENTCRKELDDRQKDLQNAINDGVEGKDLRIIKSYVEGASQNLKYSNLLRNCGFSILHLPVCFIKFDNLNFASVPGELFSSLINREDIIYICYANGYYRYIPDNHAFDNRYYEALGAIIKPGQGEVLIDTIEKEF